MRSSSSSSSGCEHYPTFKRGQPGLPFFTSSKIPGDCGPEAAILNHGHNDGRRQTSGGRGLGGGTGFEEQTGSHHRNAFLPGFSQCAFQANEITGLLFVIGVLTFSWRMAVFYVLSVFIATVVARLLKADRTLLDLGCDIGQGTGIAAPMPASQVATWAANYKGVFALAPAQGTLQGGSGAALPAS